jgi:hypothetical protein
LLGVLVAVALMVGFDAPGAEAHGRLGDSVVGAGVVLVQVVGQPGSITTGFEFDARSAPGGENAGGQVILSGFWTSGAVACLEVRTRDIGTVFNEATMNLVTPEQGLVTVQVSDGNPEGLPDFMSIRTFSTRLPTDCSPLLFGTATVLGQVREGDIDLVNAPPPNSPEQCRRGGWRKFGYTGVRQCIAAVQPPLP